MRKQPAAGLGQCYAAAVTFEEHLPKFNLQRAHLSTQDRLGDGKNVCRAREASQFRHLDEIFKLSQFHKRL